LTLAHREDGWIPPIVKTIATEGRGVEELKTHIDTFVAKFANSEQRLARKRAAARHQLTGMLQERLVQKAIAAAFPGSALDHLVDRIARHEEDPHALVERLLGPSRKVDHIGVAVKSIPEALKLYEGVLGLKVSGYEDVVEQGARVAMLPIGDSRIELLEPLQADSPVGRFLAKRGEGIHHIAICVDNIQSALDRFKDAGVKLIDSAPRSGAGGSKIAFVHPAGMHGVLLELVEHGK
jgi:methylmalonyl-CoA epimerase